jgi:hypothetical protein
MICELIGKDRGISSKSNEDEDGYASYDTINTRAMTIQMYAKYQINKIAKINEKMICT